MVIVWNINMPITLSVHFARAPAVYLKAWLGTTWNNSCNRRETAQSSEWHAIKFWSFSQHILGVVLYSLNAKQALWTFIKLVVVAGVLPDGRIGMIYRADALITICCFQYSRMDVGNGWGGALPQIHSDGFAQKKRNSIGIMLFLCINSSTYAIHNTQSSTGKVSIH